MIRAKFYNDYLSLNHLYWNDLINIISFTYASIFLENIVQFDVTWYATWAL